MGQRDDAVREQTQARQIEAVVERTEHGKMLKERFSNVEEQAPPTPDAGKAVWDLVMLDMIERDKIGRERYGTPLQAFNGRDPLVDAYQEALDLVVYLRQALEERAAGTIPAVPHRAALVAENKRLNEQVDALQGRMSEMVNGGLHRTVSDFTTLVGQPAASKPSVPDDQTVKLRLKLAIEEVLEELEASLVIWSAEPFLLRHVRENLARIIAESKVRVDLVALADAWADKDYINEGSRIAFGVDGGPIAKIVHEANMKKRGGGLDNHGKAVKPEGWEPPEKAIAAELRRQGWEG